MVDPAGAPAPRILNPKTKFLVSMFDHTYHPLQNITDRYQTPISQNSKPHNRIPGSVCLVSPIIRSKFHGCVPNTHQARLLYMISLFASAAAGMPDEEVFLPS